LQTGLDRPIDKSAVGQITARFRVYSRLTAQVYPSFPDAQLRTGE
jgi:hypothetical protein